jgi:hypothetical protein
MTTAHRHVSLAARHVSRSSLRRSEFVISRRQEQVPVGTPEVVRLTQRSVYPVWIEDDEAHLLEEVAGARDVSYLTGSRPQLGRFALREALRLRARELGWDLPQRRGCRHRARP